MITAVFNLKHIFEFRYKASTIIYQSMPYLVMVYAMTVLMAWHYLGRAPINSSSNLGTMQPVTSLCFLISGLAMLLHLYQKPRARDYVSGCFNTIGVLALTAYCYNNEALNALPIPMYDQYYIIVPGVPSWATVILFAIFSLSHFVKNKKIPGGFMMLVAGIILILGYGADIAFCRFYIESKSSAVAFTTALIFFHQGAWLFPWNDLKRKRN